MMSWRALGTLLPGTLKPTGPSSLSDEEKFSDESESAPSAFRLPNIALSQPIEFPMTDDCFYLLRERIS